MIAVLTTPRPENYYRRTVEQIAAQRPRSRCHVFSDVEPELPDGWGFTLIPREHAFGNGHPYRKALQAAEAAGEDLIMFEDDVNITGGAIHYVEDFKIPDDLALVSFCQSLVREESPWGLYRAPGWVMRMTQFCKFSRAGLRLVLDGWSEEASKTMNQSMSDTGIAFALGGARRQWGMHIPDLGNHVGFVSTLTRELDANKRCNNFPGASFDAAVLRNQWGTGIYD